MRGTPSRPAPNNQDARRPTSRGAGAPLAPHDAEPARDPLGLSRAATGRRRSPGLRLRPELALLDVRRFRTDHCRDRPPTVRPPLVSGPRHPRDPVCPRPIGLRGSVERLGPGGAMALRCVRLEGGARRWELPPLRKVSRSTLIGTGPTAVHVAVVRPGLVRFALRPPYLLPSTEPPPPVGQWTREAVKGTDSYRSLSLARASSPLTGLRCTGVYLAHPVLESASVKRPEAPRIFRVLLQVGTLEPSQRFYESLLAVRGRQVGGGRVYFDCGPVILALLDPSMEGSVKISPLPEPVYFATADLEGTHRRARQLGCLSPDLIHNDPANPAGEIVVRPWGERSFYAADPAGNPLCFVDSRSLFTGTSRQTAALRRAPSHRRATRRRSTLGRATPRTRSRRRT